MAGLATASGNPQVIAAVEAARRQEQAAERESQEALEKMRSHEATLKAEAQAKLDRSAAAGGREPSMASRVLEPNADSANEDSDDDRGAERKARQRISQIPTHSAIRTAGSKVSTSHLPSGQKVFEGWLRKRPDGSFGKLKNRWFVPSDDGEIKYYKGPDLHYLKGTVHLIGLKSADEPVQLLPLSERTKADTFTFTIATPERKWHLTPGSEGQWKAWKKNVNAVVLNLERLSLAGGSAKLS